MGITSPTFFFLCSGGVFVAQAAYALPQSETKLLCVSTPSPSDRTLEFCQNPNFPIFGSGTTTGVITHTLPTNSAAGLGDGLALVSDAVNAFSLVMGKNTPGANMVTSASIRDMFYFNYITGNLFTTIGCPIDTGQACGQSPFAAVARHYAAGDPNDLHVMAENGMQLKATCSGHDKNDCSVGHVFAAMVRLPFEIRPGMTVKVRYKSPKGPYSWAPIWLVSGSEVSPGPETATNPYAYPYNYPIQAPVDHAIYEVDMNDNYGRWSNDPSVPMRRQLDYGTPDIYGVPWKIPPYIAYMNDTDGFESFPAASPPFVEFPPEWSWGFHDLVMSWNAQTNMISMYADGKLAVQSYLDYSFAPWYTDPADGVYKQQAMHLIIGNQAIPGFEINAGTATNNDSMINGWTVTVQEISAWYGTVQQTN